MLENFLQKLKCFDINYNDGWLRKRGSSPLAQTQMTNPHYHLSNLHCPGVQSPWQRKTFIFPYECYLLFFMLLSLNKCGCLSECVCIWGGCLAGIELTDLQQSCHEHRSPEAAAYHQPPPRDAAKRARHVTVDRGSLKSSLMFNLQKLLDSVCVCEWRGVFAQKNFSGMLVCTCVCAQRWSMLTHIPADMNMFTSRWNY